MANKTPYIEGYYTQFSQELIASLFEIKEKIVQQNYDFLVLTKNFLIFFKKSLNAYFTGDCVAVEAISLD